MRVRSRLTNGFSLSLARTAVTSVTTGAHATIRGPERRISWDAVLVTDSTPPRDAAAATSRARIPVGALAGVLAALLGIAPWLAGGGTLPVQNLWADGDALPEDMPFSLLPFSQYDALDLFVLIVMGGVFAGIARRTFLRTTPVWSIALGLALGHAIAITQAFIVTSDGLVPDDSRATIYLTGIVLGTLIGVAFSQLGLWLIAQPATVPAALGLALAAHPIASWLADWAYLVVDAANYPTWFLAVLRWLPAVIVGAALAWCGFHPVRRLFVWVIALATLLITPAAFTAIQYALGTRVFGGDLGMMAEAVAQVFPAALPVGVGPVVAATVLGALGAVAIRMSRPQPADTSR